MGSTNINTVTDTDTDTPKISDHDEKTATLLIFVVRKPGTTFAAFKEYYEGHHASFMTNMVLSGDNKPRNYTREYIEHEVFKNGEADGLTGKEKVRPKSFPLGGHEGWYYDCVTRIVFKNRSQRDGCLEAYARNHIDISEDEARFVDMTRTRIVFVEESVANVF